MFLIFKKSEPQRSYEEGSLKKVLMRKTRPTAMSRVLSEQYLIVYTKTQKCMEVSELYGSLKKSQKCT